MHLITKQAYEIVWETLTMEINSLLRQNSQLERPPMVEFIEGSSQSPEDLRLLTLQVDERIETLSHFGEVTKQWIRLPSNQEVFAIVKWPSPYIDIQFVTSGYNLGIQFDFKDDPFIKIIEILS